MTKHRFFATGTFDDDTNKKELHEQFESLKLVVGNNDTIVFTNDKKIEDLNNIENKVLVTDKQTTEIGNDSSLPEPALKELATKITAAKTAAASTPDSGKFTLGGSRARGGSYKRTQKRRQRKQQRRNGNSKRV